MLKSPKQKGSRLEREWAELLRIYDIDKKARRMPLSGGFDDLRMKADIFTELSIHFEVKNQETWSPLTYYRQAKSTSGSKIPVVVLSRNREQIYTFLLGTDFLTILKFAIKGGYMGKQKINKPQKPKRQSLEDTAHFAFSKKHQVRRKNKKA